MPIRLLVAALTALLFYTMLAAHAASISVSSSVENVSYDLGFAILSLENIDSRMRISPTVEGKLLIEDVNAKRLVITMVEDPPPPAPSSGLPDKINLPFPIRVKAARIAEVIIQDGEDKKSFTDVAFNLEADDKLLALELVHATTPWGMLVSHVALENAKPFALDGQVQLKHSDSETPYDIDLKLGGNLERLQFNTAGLLSRQGKQTSLLREDADITPEQLLGKIAIHGNLGLGGDLPLDIKAQLIGFGAHTADNQKVSKLNLDMLLQGNLGPQANLAIDIEAMDSLWQGEPLSLKANAKLVANVLEQIEVNARLKNNQLQANGAIGKPASPLTWQARFDDLGAFDNTMSGKFSAQGVLEGSLDKLALNMELLAEQLRLAGDVQIRQLSGKATLTNMAGGQLNADISAQDVSLQKNGLFNAELTLRGTREKHQIELKTIGAAQKPIKDQFHTLLTGGFSENNQWLAQIEKLTYQGDKPIVMERSASLKYDGSAGFQLSDLALRFADGHVYLDLLRSGNAQFATRGRIVNLGLESLPGLIVSLPSNITGNPVFSGAWDLNAENEANGQADIRLENGDIGISAGDGSVKPLGLKTLIARLQIQENRITVNSQASGTGLGDLNFELVTRLSQTASGLAISQNSPLEVKADASLKTLAWLPMPESMVGASIDGQLNMTLQGNGTIDRPNFTGVVNGRNLALAIPGEGVNLSNGVLDATFNDDRLVIKQARFQGGDGFLTANGSLQLARGDANLNLDWQAEKFTAVSRTDRLIVIDGKLNTTLSSNLLEVSGQIEIIRGLIELAREDKPTLGDDVVVIGREPELVENALLMKVTDLKIGMGNTGQFVLRGRGLDSTLVGRITLNGLPDQALRAEGSIVAAGTYMAYGQVLNIERGQLNFSGPVDNPGLNILALRQNMAVRAGVEIKGNVLNPSVKLVSIPEVSDSDKLSWLVLGHGIDQAGQDQFAMLSLAAGALLSQGQSVPLQTRFARAAGLDSFNVGGSDAQNTSVSLGKRLASNLYLTYEKEVTGLLNVARLTYDITNRWSIRTQAGSESAVDVLYTFSFK